MGKAKSFMEDTDSDVLTEIKQSKSSNESETEITNSSNEGDWIDYSQVMSSNLRPTLKKVFEQRQ